MLWRTASVKQFLCSNCCSSLALGSFSQSNVKVCLLSSCVFVLQVSCSHVDTQDSFMVFGRISHARNIEFLAQCSVYLWCIHHRSRGLKLASTRLTTHTHAHTYTYAFTHTHTHVHTRRSNYKIEDVQEKKLTETISFPCEIIRPA